MVAKKQNGSRIEDNPFFIAMAEDLKEIKDDQHKIRDAIFDPEKGIHQRLQHLEIWKKNINEERLNYKKWLGRIFWTLVAALLFGGGILGWVLKLAPK